LKKELLVAFSDTVVDPRTMMIHLLYASLANPKTNKKSDELEANLQ
jgi:hypothetical protein